MTESTARDRVLTVLRKSQDLYPRLSDDGRSLLEALTKASAPDAVSGQRAAEGTKDHPFNMEKVRLIRDFNPWHSTCIETKVSSTVGLGHYTDGDRLRKRAKETGEVPPEDVDELSKAEKVLDDLCDRSWQDLIHDVIEDYWQAGNGFIEVVRAGDRIIGLYHIRPEDVYVVVENEEDIREKHFQVFGDEGQEVTMAPFGERDEFLARIKNANGGSGMAGVKLPDNENVSEVIHLMRSSSNSKWYGYPDWLSATPAIELIQALHQYGMDFFINRGVPEFLLFILGSKLDDKDWEAIEEAMQKGVGHGNSHKAGAFNLDGVDTKVQVEKLGIGDNSDSTFKNYLEPGQLEIVSAHRVPPLLAGIQIPGKMGAANEMTNSMLGFQQLVIAPAQKAVTSYLARTLGKETGLSYKDLQFKSILDKFDLGQADTAARMRQPATEAQAQGRDLKDGLKD